MVKPLIWIGTLIAVLGVVVIAFFVVPYVGVDRTPEAVPSANAAATALAAVITGGIAIAAGSALIGVGVGRWERPRRTHTLPLGQSHDGREV